MTVGDVDLATQRFGDSTEADGGRRAVGGGRRAVGGGRLVCGRWVMCGRWWDMVLVVDRGTRGSGRQTRNCPDCGGENGHRCSASCGVELPSYQLSIVQLLAVQVSSFEKCLDYPAVETSSC